MEITEAIEKGDIEVVKQHLAAGADVNANWNRLEPNGYTLLHLAAHWGNGEIVELLIVENAKMNAMDVEGQTPLDVAIQYMRTEIADLLREHGGKTGEELRTG